MHYNFLDSTDKRIISTCNYNQHIRTTHPDRVMKEHDLIYIRDGCWNISQEGIDYDVVPGDVVLLHGGCHHYGVKPCEETVRTCFVHFSMHSNDRVETENADNRDFWVFPTVVHCNDNPMVEHYFSRIIYSYWSENEYDRKKASAYLDLLLCEIAGGKESVRGHYSMVDEIKLEIKKTPNRFIGVREFAEKYHCSVRTVSSKFKESTGCSLHAWQMKLKCQMADELMRCDSSLTLKEIAATYGFYDEYHFGKSFKKAMGHSPKKSK